MKYLIKRIVPVEISQAIQSHEPVKAELDGETVTLFRQITVYEKTMVDTFQDVEEFEEKPAPDVTLGGRLLALKNETGYEHVAVEAPQSGEKS